MEKIRAGSLKEGDLVHVDDSYFEVMDARYDIINPKPFGAFVLVKCFMCPSNSPFGPSVGTYSHIRVGTEVLLLSRG